MTPPTLASTARMFSRVFRVWARMSPFPMTRPSRSSATWPLRWTTWPSPWMAPMENAPNGDQTLDGLKLSITSAGAAVGTASKKLGHLPADDVDQAQPVGGHAVWDAKMRRHHPHQLTGARDERGGLDGPHSGPEQNSLSRTAREDRMRLDVLHGHPLAGAHRYSAG